MALHVHTAFVYVGGKGHICFFNVIWLKLQSLDFSDSDDSDTEGGLGNVERVVMRPPGHSGKAKRGHLCFDSSFETGRV